MMKTREEQLEYATKLQMLTREYGQLIKEMKTVADRLGHLAKVQALNAQLRDLNDQYLGRETEK